MDFTIKLCCDLIGEDDVSCAFLVRYSPGTDDVMYMTNGDPGYPGDPAECEVLGCYRETGEALSSESFCFRNWPAVEEELHDTASDLFGEYERDSYEED
jgi:hypothetical protein